MILFYCHDSGSCNFRCFVLPYMAFFVRQAAAKAAPLPPSAFPGTVPDIAFSAVVIS